MSRNDFKGMTTNERLYFSGNLNNFKKALKRNDEKKVREILQQVYVDDKSIELILKNNKISPLNKIVKRFLNFFFLN